ncbi:V-set domain-containing T-cell activation inhibitor 1-like [Onychostoma macrolepis]|uniref:V-set domain-containing T-cell activation inhibitor 1-like n=1 Tax=Onychostoma macrolepis TaxID=369639 RepID=UPI00272B4117|nr:V-set domain-containing T-cell activation inhibitor 1-like [Onychostoma macrolepis]
MTVSISFKLSINLIRYDNQKPQCRIKHFKKGRKEGSFNLILIFCFICVFAVLINKVCLQVTVEAVIGGSVVLPCSFTKDDNKLQDIDVSWRHNGSKIVFDIIPHSTSPVTQDAEYENRTETFPEEYLRGNFSIKLNNLQHTDAGQYICYIKNADAFQTVKLIISGSISTEQGNQGETEQDGMGPLLLVCIILPVMLVIVVIIFILVFWRKKCSISHRQAGLRIVTNVL